MPEGEIFPSHVILTLFFILAPLGTQQTTRAKAALNRPKMYTSSIFPAKTLTAHKIIQDRVQTAGTVAEDPRQEFPYSYEVHVIVLGIVRGQPIEGTRDVVHMDGQVAQGEDQNNSEQHTDGLPTVGHLALS